MNDTREQLDRAIAAIKSRQFETAREVLKVLINKDPNLVDAWLLYADFAPSRDQARQCLERALRIDPHNPRGLKMMEQLQAHTSRNQPTHLSSQPAQELAYKEPSQKSTLQQVPLEVSAPEFNPDQRPTPTKTKTPRLAFGKLLLNESRLAWRIPVGLGVGLGLPILLLVILGLIPRTLEPSSDLGGLSYFALLYPILVAVTILSQSINMLPRNLIKYRETGILRHLSVTPVPPSWLLAAQIVINLAIALIGIILLTAVGVAVFGLALPKNLPGFLLADLLTITSLFSIGLFIAAVVQSDALAQGIGGILFFALLFFGGLWIPRPLMPAALLNISNWTPLGASVAALQNAMEGSFPSLHSLLVLVAYTAVFSYLSVRYFKWE
jgi:ABC-2 type transport system permease protein